MKKLTFILLLTGFLFAAGAAAYAADRVVVVPLSSAAPQVTDTDTDVATEVFNGMNNSDASPRYAGIAGSQDGSSIDGKVFPVTRSTTITNFTVYISTNTLGGDNCTITLQKSGTDTAISKTYTSTDIATTVDVITGSVSYEPGDRFSIYAQTGGIASSGAFHYAGAFDLVYK